MQETVLELSARGGRIAAGSGLFAGGPFAAGLIAGGLFASGLNAATRHTRNIIYTFQNKKKVGHVTVSFLIDENLIDECLLDECT